MKKVILLGDRIRMQYQDRVRELLADICEVVWPDMNCGYTLSTLWFFKKQHAEYGGEGMDLIHWNTGIWDLHRTLDDGEPLVTPGEYLYENKRLHKLLASYTSNLIWATTTPAGEQYKYDPNTVYGVSREQWNKEVFRNNASVSAYLRSEGVKINDLHALVCAHPEYLAGDGICLTDAGIEAVARQTADCIRAALEGVDEVRKDVGTAAEKQIQWY